MKKSLLFTDVGKLCSCREFLTWQICLLTLLAENNSRENFQFYSIYMDSSGGRKTNVDTDQIESLEF